MKTIISHSEEETKKIAQKMVQNLELPAIICLYGELGSGKTTFTKGLATALGLNEKKIKSPTYAFLRSHKIKSGSFHHFDFYRIEKLDDLLIKEIEEIFQNQHSLILIEWPERIAHLLPEKRLEIYFSHEGENTRKISHP